MLQAQSRFSDLDRLRSLAIYANSDSMNDIHHQHNTENENNNDNNDTRATNDSSRYAVPT
eukprot:5956379-Amphidinium_carterae.1